MKAQTTLSQVIVQVIGCLILVSTAVPALAQESARKPVDPRGPLAKQLGWITQLGSDIGGNGFIFDAAGCYVMTNVHVAFGKSKPEVGGAVELIDEDKIVPGHVVNFAIDLDAKTGRFTRNLKARVVQFDAYEAGTDPGTLGDKVILRLDDCLGKAYGNVVMDNPPANKIVPSGDLTTMSIERSADGKFAIVSQTGCHSASLTLVTGLFVSNCQTPPGSSGSMVFENIDGKLRFVGMPVQLRNNNSISIYVKNIAKFVSEVLGEAPLAVNPLADTRAPQNDLASAAKARTVVR